ncbi:MAG: hypothetical protein J6A15_09885 [Clostridia bacterium]|nr:hypothetical protein [Clostridia bacterium]
MDKKKILIIAGIVLAIVIIISIILINTKHEFNLDTDMKFLVTTDEKTYTYADDGGSHINSYYEIDLEKKTVSKREDKYVGLKGYKYQGKLLYTKKLTDEECTQLQNLLNDVISAGPATEADIITYGVTYTLDTKNGTNFVLHDGTLVKFIELVKE